MTTATPKPRSSTRTVISRGDRNLPSMIQMAQSSPCLSPTMMGRSRTSTFDNVTDKIAASSFHSLHQQRQAAGDQRARDGAAEYLLVHAGVEAVTDENADQHQREQEPGQHQHVAGELA